MMQRSPLTVLLLLLLILQLTRGSYFLTAMFHTYENSLHSFLNMSSSPIRPQCCDGQETPNCTEPCNTFLNYCFKKIGTVNNFSNDTHILDDCLDERTSLTELTVPMDYIDFSDPPLTVSGIATRSALSNKGYFWPGGIQFLVRSTVTNHIVDYLFDDIYLSPGQLITNHIFYGQYFGENVTFTASFKLNCRDTFYGENCDIQCIPSNSTEGGFYTCSSAGGKDCMERFTGDSCTECETNFTGPLCNQYLDMCGFTEPCVQGNCTNAGPNSYHCECDAGYHGANCNLDMCRFTEPCVQGNCTNTGPDSYHCECDAGYHGVNCSEEIIPDVHMSYTLVIVGSVAGLLAPVVILLPLILVLCFTAFGSWKKNKKNEYVTNPLYGEATPPTSATNTIKSGVDNSERGTSNTTAEIQVTDSETATPAALQLDDDNPEYDTIPAEQNFTGRRGLSPAAPSVTSTFRSDDGTYYALSISTLESMCPYSYTPDINFPPMLPERGLPPSIPNSFQSGPSFLEMTNLSSEEVPSDYIHPLEDPKCYYDIVPAQNNGTITIRPPLPPMNKQLAIRRSKTVGSRAQYSRGSTQSRSSAHHRPLAKSSSSEVPRRHFNHSLDQQKFLHSSRRRGLPPVPPHRVQHTASPSFGSDKECTRIFVSDSTHSSTLSTLNSPAHHSRAYMTDTTNSTTLASDTNHSSSWSMSKGELSSSYRHPTPMELSPDYDEVPEETHQYDVPTSHHLTAAYETYDVPRKEASA